MAYQVKVVETGAVFQVEPEEKLLEAATRQGVRIYSECEFGGCGTCRIKVTEGAVQYEDDFLPMSLSDEEHVEGFAAACQALVTQDISISIANHLDVLPEPKTLPLQVESLSTPSQGVYELHLRSDALLESQYWPGQYLNILLADGERARSFSMASATAKDGIIRLFIRDIEGGHFTQQVLPTLQKGQELQVELPLGNFYYRKRDWKPVILLATGTGIAPVRAIIESLIDDEDRPPLHLYWGVRKEADLHLMQELKTWAEHFPDFEFTPVLSNADADWTGRTGYVQDAAYEDYDDLSEYAFYMCGAPAMIQDAQSKLKDRGADSDYMYSDAFTFQHDLMESN